MRHIIRGKLTPAEREAAIEALNSHQQRYGNYAKQKTSSTYRVKIEDRIIPVEIVNRSASYVAGPQHYANSDLKTLISAGMMTSSPAPKFCRDGDVVYSCTDTGRDIAISALPPPPKPTRYSEYLDADSCMSFSEWLLGWKAAANRRIAELEAPLRGGGV
ncbi:hypothetical protein PB70LOC_03263 [Pectobacterium versatile]|uniref:DUF4060 family protein n=1 Tax=Pectobacterium versatile TaxID=2488639 RepID=UPI000D3F3492|nr:DUF4060 family protein [Pectobacterium versatile]POY57379.1 hypothetical protein PB70LOC_03263 [Pectobacterium versatile]POY61535.1 hypothetical protein PB69LOC_03502 [Pectobacterium versatile]